MESSRLVTVKTGLVATRWVKRGIGLVVGALLMIIQSFYVVAGYVLQIDI